VPKVISLLMIIALVVSPLCAASSAPPSDPQAVAFAAKSIAAMTGGSAIADVTLSGNVTRVAGSDQQTGTATLTAKGFAESRVDLALSGGARSEARNASAGPSVGNWLGPDGVVHAVVSSNCYTDATWFYPALGALSAAATNPSLVLVYVGQESSYQHLQAYTYDANFSTTKQLSTTDFYLDAQTLLPSIVMFNVHPDNDSTVNIAIQVMFSDYRNVNGAMIPFHIQRYVNDSLLLDIQLTSASINTGISDSNFSLH
jgi:hypothetical protein